MIIGVTQRERAEMELRQEAAAFVGAKRIMATNAYSAASRARLVDELLDIEAIFALGELRALAEAEEMTYRRPAAMACA